MEKWEGRRRLVIGGGWAACNFITVMLQPFLKLDLPLVSKLVETSTYVAIVGIVGLSGTDVMTKWAGTKTCNGNGEKNGGNDVTVATSKPTKEEG